MILKKIEISNLWGNDFAWTLNKDVSVIIGKNGTGKSTILQMIYEALSATDDSSLNFRVFDPIDEIIIELDNEIVIRANSENRIITGNANVSDYKPNISYINTFDVIEKSLNPNSSLLDFEIEKLKHSFVKYQRDLSNQVEEAFKNQDELTKKAQLDNIGALYETKNTFIEILNKLFQYTGKSFDEKSFNFIKTGIQNPIEPQKLSSGEKQLLIILLTVLLQDKKQSILVMDEPEISLHIDWQRCLIEYIRALNANCQIIIATHSPTTYYQGWIDKIFRIEDMFSANNLFSQSKILTEKGISKHKKLQKIKKEFDQFSGSKLSNLFQFNQILNTYTSFAKEECIELLDFLKSKIIYPDVITFTTLISKLNDFNEAKEIFYLMIAEKYTNLKHSQPNEITLNTLIKKANNVEIGLEFIQEVSSNEKLRLYPDIITFSTLLGKARNTNEIRLIEEARKYYRVKPNEIYLNKLNFKR